MARRARAPWALLLAIGLMVIFDLWIRTWPLERRVAYGEDEQQAIAVKQQIIEGPAPTVAFAGSSMVYQGIATPELEARLSAELGKSVAVRNYAIRGARIDLTAAVVRKLVRKPEKPRLIVVGIAMRDLRESGLDLDRLSEFWTFADWRREARQTYVLEQLPQVIHNEVGRAWATLRYRTAISFAAQRCFIDLPGEPMPSRGERPSEHEGSRRDVTLADSLKAFSHQNNKRRMIQAYRHKLPARPPEVLSDRIGSIIEDCRRAGVKVMFVDLPISQPLTDLINTAQRKTGKRDASINFDPAYRRAVTAWTSKSRAPFIELTEFDATLTNADFYDGQHLNFSGAKKLTEAIAPLVANELK